MRSATLLAAALAATSAFAAPAPATADSDVIIGRGLKAAKRGAVATEAAPCSEIGAKVLEDGGNAVDAIISSALCVGTIAAYHSGIGGGGFGIVRYKDKATKSWKYETIDYREFMPAAGNETMYAADTDGAKLSTVGGLAAGVPGELRGWEAMWKRHGSYPWKKLFEPAVNVARNGFTVNVDLAGGIVQGQSFILSDPLWAEVYAPNGTLLVEGDTCYRKRYADTLEKIGEHGADWFYHGENAVTTTAALYARGGIMTPADMAAYEAVVRETVNITYRDSRIFSTVAPSSGSVVLSALKIFENFDGSAGSHDPAFNLTQHRLIEATQFAYGQRTQLGDPAFTPNVTYLEQLYLEPEITTALAAKISDNTTHGLSYYDPSNYTATAESGTSHMAVIDGEQMAVSLTTTVNTYWGSQVMTAAGVIMNNEMDDFSSPGQTNSFGFAASPVNYIAGHKRPQSSISSSIAEDLDTGDILIATGSAGGSRIITTTIQYLYHHLDQGLNAHQCVHYSRWHDQLSGELYLEYRDMVSQPLTIGSASRHGLLADLAPDS